jgi:hypothetical protein
MSMPTPENLSGQKGSLSSREQVLRAIACGWNTRQRPEGRLGWPTRKANIALSGLRKRRKAQCHDGCWILR